MKHTIITFLIILVGLKLLSQNPVADFDVNVIYKCGYATTEFVNNSQNADTFLWDDNGTGVFFETFEPIGSNIGIDMSWIVTLIAIGNGMSDTLSKQVDVFHTRVNFSFTFLDTNIYAPLDVELLNTSSIRDEDTLTYYWDFGDGYFSEEESPIHTFIEPETYYVTLNGLKNGNCELSTSDYIIVKDTAQRGEFDFITGGCYNDYETPPCGYDKHFDIVNDTLLIYGFYYGNCGTTKTATLRFSSDTVIVRTWEVGPMTTCSCGYCFEIVVPNITLDSTVVKFNNEIYIARISGIQEKIKNVKAINIYPNPTNNSLSVEILDPQDNNFNYEIIDLKGIIKQSGVINHQKKIQIDRQKIPEGFYIIVLKKDNEIKYTKRIIIE